MPVNNIYVDVNSMLQGNNNRLVNIFVPKKNFGNAIKLFSDIGKKVSEHSEFKELAEKLSDNKAWHLGKPKNISNYKVDNKKYFFELGIKEVSILKDMVYAYKSKFQGGNLIIGNSEIKRNSSINALLSRLKNSAGFRRAKDKQAGVGSEDLEQNLAKESENRQNAESEKFKNLVKKNFEEYNKKVNDQSKKILEVLNSCIGEENKIKFDSIECNVSEGYKANDVKISNISVKKREIMNNCKDRAAKEKIGEMFQVWLDGPGAAMANGARAYEKVQEYLKNGYKIISMLGSGGTATVVKFLNKKGKERALKIFYGANDSEEEIKAIKNMQAKLDVSKLPTSRKNKSSMRESFNVPKISKDNELSMKIAAGVLDAPRFINRNKEKCDLPISFFKRLAHDVLLGLKKLHKKGMAHGDIKPDNLHMMKEENFKIADVATVNMAEKVVPGTRAYAHPKWNINTATPERTEKNDVYAFGCSMLDILCGKRQTNYIASAKSCNAGELAKQFTDKSMNEKNISALLTFIKKLCADDIDNVPTASEALRDSFAKNR